MKHYLKKAIRLSNYLSRGDIVCRSAQLSSLCPLCHCIPLSLPLKHSVCSNEWQSGDVVLIYCMVAQREPGWNVSVIQPSLRRKHLWCPGTTNCSIRSGFHLTHIMKHTILKADVDANTQHPRGVAEVAKSFILEYYIQVKVLLF